MKTPLYKQNKKILFVTPSYSNAIYKKSKMKSVIATFPFAGSAVLAGALVQCDYEVAIADLNVAEDAERYLISKLESFKPDYVGISFTTPLFYEMKKIVEMIKKFNREITAIAGGPHASALPRETLLGTLLDLVVVGEGDQTIVDILSGKKWESIPGIAYKQGRDVVSTPVRGLVENLDDLSYPAWHLYDVSKYRGTPIFNRENPLGFYETSRGCFSRCTYCSSRNIFGMKYRYKTPERVVDEIEYMLKMGFKEVHPIDDGFSTDIKRAKAVCNEIIKRGIKINWYPQGGLRVDRVNKELFDLMYKAGCYRIPFGIESGSQLIIDNIKKGIKLWQVEQAVKWARDAGLETVGYFMLGLPGETVKTIEETIAFSHKLDLDYAKFSITIPLPGSPLYDDWKRSNIIKTDNWEMFNFASPDEVYAHPNLSWDTLNKYYKRAHRAFCWRFAYIFKRVIRNFKDFNFIEDVKAALKVKW